MEMNFEQAEAQLSKERKSELAYLMWNHIALPSDLSSAEQVFCFGLYTYMEYEQPDEIKRYF